MKSDKTTEPISIRQTSAGTHLAAVDFEMIGYSSAVEAPTIMKTAKLK